jgi:hypothetical protein
MESVHLVCHLLVSTAAVSARMTVSLGGGGERDITEESLVVVDWNTALQAAGERELGQSLDRTRRKALQEERRNKGILLWGVSESI